MENTTYVIIIAVSTIGLLAGLILKKIEHSIITEPLIAMFAGILLAQLEYSVVHSHAVLNTVAQYTIVIAITASALRIPFSFLKDFKWEAGTILIFGMAGMWMMTALIIKFVMNFNWIYCFLIGAILSPTDPVISSAIISGTAARENLPGRIRHSISFESGANDGLAFIVVALPVILLSSTEKPWNQWLLDDVLWKNLTGVIVGLFVGGFIGKMVHTAHERKWMSPKSLLPSALFLSLFVFSLCEIIGFNGIITVFASALTYGFNINKGEELKQEKIHDSLERIFVIPVFVLFGMMVPINQWLEMHWQIVILAVAVLLLRRIPVFLVIKPFLKHYKAKLRDILFLGWFGPVGVAAMFYAFYTESNLRAISDDIWPIVSFVIFSSVVIHGITSYPLAKFYAFMNEDEQSDQHIAPVE